MPHLGSSGGIGYAVHAFSENDSSEIHYLL